MDFFEAQDRAKRNTGKLIALYILAVLGIISSIYLVSIFLIYSQVYDFEGHFWNVVWNPVLFAVVSTIVLLIIVIGTLFRIAQLRKGGSAVAEMLGGRKLDPSTTEPNEGRLINIVEEMSIASGLPVPDVYVLDNEENINAFAAGLSTHDAAVGVTRGALEQLNRDELQGVIAHEFSHIFNGDMRLNIRLIGILNGILLIHIMGMLIIRSMFYSGGVRVRSRNGKGGGKSALVVALFGVALIVIGYIGMIFGRMIQAAVSRQREYLADAAAVQYTRNPDGLAGALRKIGRTKKGAEIKDGHAMEMSHLFFASSFHSALDRLYSTHPPLEKRIQAISPSLTLDDERRQKRIHKKFQKDRISGSESTGVGETGIAGHPALTPEVILAAIGTLNSNHINRAGKLLSSVPDKLKEAAHEPLSAQGLIFALLLTANESDNNIIREWISNNLDAELGNVADRLVSKIPGGERKWHLALAELALPTLRQMSENQYKPFRERVRKLVQKNENIFSFALEKMIIRQLDTSFSNVKTPEVRHHHLKTLGDELSVLLSALSHVSDTDSEAAWQAGLKPIQKVMPENVRFLPKDQCGLDILDGAIDELAASANPVKKYVLSAMIHCVVADKKVTTGEKELLRAVSEAMDCPIPLGAMA